MADATLLGLLPGQGTPLVYGALASTASLSIVYPFEHILRWQGGAKAPMGVLALEMRSSRVEIPLLHPWRNMLQRLPQFAVNQAVTFGLWEAATFGLSRLLLGSAAPADGRATAGLTSLPRGTRAEHVMVHAAAGAATMLTHSLTLHPWEVVHNAVRQERIAAAVAERPPKFTGLMDCARQIYLMKGPGSRPLLQVSAPLYGGILFGSFSLMRGALDREQPYLAPTLLAGVTAALVADIPSFTVARVLNYAHRDAVALQERRSIVTLVKEMVLTEGWRSLITGPPGVLSHRIYRCVLSGMCLAIYDYSKQMNDD